MTLGEMGKEEHVTDFYVLPEECISHTLSLTSPPDVCRSTLVSTVFKRAAESDMVWEKFMPSDIQEIISRSVSPYPLIFSSRRVLYFFLCDHPILIDGGNKSFALDKSTGKKIYMLGARDLTIVWGSTPEYWRWIALPESRFPEVAELLAVCWLEISGNIETRMLSRKTTYKAYLVMKLSKDGVYGLNHPPADVSVSFVGSGSGSSGVSSGRPVYLNTKEDVYLDSDDDLELELEGQFPRDRGDGQLPRDRGDGWMEVEMGEFFTDEGEDGEVKMTLTETRGGHWKRGLLVQGIEFRPH